MEAHGDKLPPYLSIVGKDTKISNRLILYDLGLNKLQIICIKGKDIKMRIVSHFKNSASLCALHIKSQSKENTLVQNRRSSNPLQWTSRVQVVQFNGLVV